MSVDKKLYEVIKNSGITLILSVPCIMLKGLLEIIEEKNEIQHISVTREEEGVGIAAGAYFGGRTPAILMQNSGLGNSINAIKSLLELYQIPVVFIMSHRGMEGEKIAAQIPMGQATSKLLDIINVKQYILNESGDINEIKKAVEYGQSNNNPVAILLTRSLWGRDE